MRILLYKPNLDLRHIRKQAYEHLSSEYSVFCQVANDMLEKIPLNTETVTASQFGRDGYNTHLFIKAKTYFRWHYYTQTSQRMIFWWRYFFQKIFGR